MKLETFNIKELKPAEYNPRKPLTSSSPIYRKIRKSIEELGYSSPIIVNSDMTVISGHQRLTVLKDMGWKEVQCKTCDKMLPTDCWGCSRYKEWRRTHDKAVFGAF